MPKERLHILLAHETLRVLEESHAAEGDACEGYLLAAILPDTFFYDLPSLQLGNTSGRAIHKYEGPKIVDFFGSWLDAEEGRLTREMKYWMLGFASHLLADGMMHPRINAFCTRFGKNLGLTATACHHWLESQLESHWLEVIGPPHGYIPLLHRFESQDAAVMRHVDYVRRFLQRAQPGNIPSRSRIRRCLNWQLRLLRLFACPAWETIRPMLLRLPPAQFLGALLVPPVSDLCTFEGRALRANLNRELCTPDFMAGVISHLATHLRELLKRF